MDKPVRRPSPTLYFVLGTMWTVLAAGGWGTSGGMVATVAFTLLAVANLGLGAFLLRKQRRTARADVAER
ncbi:hypothetical protein QOZ88_05430 [Blastococcus sp. BMG 814]|uniref:Uncharacterized protein n=1 Tax=Blastococcus carthaginiensis TaxID=3050034 RepID=A0ABT9I928_9ACTN|nr:hypothetical protein [Blastococcus carthaginiensis]MDP5182071.1 hypothetical protein [Blastococcus carthaginiensis]